MWWSWSRVNECNSGAPRKKFSRYSRTSHLERISKRTQVVEVPMLQNLEGFSPGAHRGAYTEL